MQEKITLSETDSPERMPDSSGMRNQWIADRLKELGKSKAGLADALGLPRPRITEIMKGDRVIKAAEILPLARYLELDPGYVLLRITSKTDVEPAELPFIHLQIRGAVQAGAWAQAMELPRDEWEVVAVPRPDGHKQYFGLRVKGPSMNLVYPEGTILVCVPVRRVPSRAGGRRPRHRPATRHAHRYGGGDRQGIAAGRLWPYLALAAIKPPRAPNTAGSARALAGLSRRCRLPRDRDRSRCRSRLSGSQAGNVSHTLPPRAPPLEARRGPSSRAFRSRVRNGA